MSNEERSSGETKAIESGLFRSKSLEKITSPDDLDDYVRVANPGVWILLAAIVILLAGFIVWARFAKLETTIPAIVDNDSGVTTCYVSEKYVSDNMISVGMTVKSEGQEYIIQRIDGQALDAVDILSDYELHLGNFASGEWINAVALDRDAEKGAHPAEIVIDDVSPISFILNR